MLWRHEMYVPDDRGHLQGRAYRWGLKSERGLVWEHLNTSELISRGWFIYVHSILTGTKRTRRTRENRWYLVTRPLIPIRLFQETLLPQYDNRIDDVTWLQLPACFAASYCFEHFFCGESLGCNTNLNWQRSQRNFGSPLWNYNSFCFLQKEV